MILSFILGYYADHLSVNQETRGNSTVKVKNESRGFHLNNLSYAGPIVMGVGGKIWKILFYVFFPFAHRFAVSSLELHIKVRNLCSINTYDMKDLYPIYKNKYIYQFISF